MTPHECGHVHARMPSTCPERELLTARLLVSTSATSMALSVLFCVPFSGSDSTLHMLHVAKNGTTRVFIPTCHGRASGREAKVEHRAELPISSEGDTNNRTGRQEKMMIHDISKNVQEVNANVQQQQQGLNDRRFSPPTRADVSRTVSNPSDWGLTSTLKEKAKPVFETSSLQLPRSPLLQPLVRTYDLA